MSSKLLIGLIIGFVLGGGATYYTYANEINVALSDVLSISDLTQNISNNVNDAIPDDISSEPITPALVTSSVKPVDCTARGPGVDLHGCNFSGTQNGPKISFKSIDLSYANLSGADLKWAKFHATSLYHANLHGADFRYAIFWNTNFNDADLSDADFRGAKLPTTTFNGANLNGTYFEGADYDSPFQFTGCKGTPAGAHYNLCNPDIQKKGKDIPKPTQTKPK